MNQLMKQEPQQLVPSYMAGQGQRGLELASQDDITYPRLALAQANSPSIKKSSDKRIEGLEEGFLYDTLTGEIYGDTIEIVPIRFFKSYIRFRPESEGGGVMKMAANADNIAPVDLEFGPNGEKPVWTEFRNFLSYIPATGRLAVVSMKSTQTKVAKQWVSLMRFAGVPAYGKSYELSTVSESNQNYDYFNFNIKPLGFVDEVLYHKLDVLYGQLTGKDVKFDTADIDDDAKTVAF